jgi:hypothetical protein
VTHHLYLAFLVLGPLVGCASTPPPAAPSADSRAHDHELHLPPVGPTVHVTLDGKGADIDLASIPHDGPGAPLLALFKAAWPAEDPSSLHFDLVGSDGFHPSSRPLCMRLLSGAEVAAAHIDIVTHNVTYDDPVKLPGCYRVKAVVTMDAIH